MNAPLWRPGPVGLSASFGFGDRLGLATPGHLASCRGTGIRPVLAQQSIREMTRTRRSAEDVIAAARTAVVAEDWTGGWGADADHLKTEADIDRCAAAGFCLFTLDPSECVDAEADRCTETELRQKHDRIRPEVDWVDAYRGRRVRLASGDMLELSELELMRAAVKYGRAANRAVALAEHLQRIQTAAGREFEVELSVDETDHPTSLAEHYLMADQCLRRGMKLISLAPRLLGDFEKGIDYRGDVQALDRSLRAHQAIADLFGGYKLSLHSGSDKLSMYGVFARATRGRFHVKTAGTSYLEALRVAARVAPTLFRRICDFARERYDVDRATYHVHATLSGVPAPAQVSGGEELERVYLGRWEDTAAGLGLTSAGRQILHCTFGSVLTHPELGTDLKECVQAHAMTYRELLAEHFRRHLQALGFGT